MAGSTSTTLGTLTAAGTGTVEVGGSTSATLGAVSGTATGAAAVAATLGIADASWLTRFPSDESPLAELLIGTPDEFSAYLGQEFSVASSEMLTALDLRAGRIGDPPDNVYVEIRAGGRDGTVIGTSAVVAASSAPTYPGQPSAFVTLAFPTPVALTPGTYAWVLKRDGAGDFANVLIVGMDRSTASHGRVNPAHFALIYDGTVDDWDVYYGLPPSSGFEYRLQLERLAGPLTATAAGTVDVVGTTSTTLGPLTVVGEGVVGEPPREATLAATLGALTGAGTGTVDVVGTTTATLGAVTLTGLGGLDITGAASVTLGAVTTTGTGTVDVVGTTAATLGALTAAGTGRSSSRRSPAR